MAIAAFVLSIIALTVATVSAVYTRRQALANETSAEVSQSQHESQLEAAKGADVQVSYRDQRVLLINAGPAIARNVRVHLDDEWQFVDSEHQATWEAVFPALHPGETEWISLLNTDESTCRSVTTWEDGKGEQRREKKLRTF
jgi:hypothetical protein